MVMLKDVKFIRVENWDNRYELAIKLMEQDSDIIPIIKTQNEYWKLEDYDGNLLVIFIHDLVCDTPANLYASEKYLIMDIAYAEEVLPKLSGRAMIMVDADSVYENENAAVSMARGIKHLKDSSIALQNTVTVSLGKDGKPAIDYDVTEVNKRETPLVIAAPRQSGKTWAIIKQMHSDPKSIMVVASRIQQERLRHRHPAIAMRIYTSRDIFKSRVPHRGKNVCVDDFDDVSLNLLSYYGIRPKVCMETVGETEERPVLVSREELSPGTTTTLTWYSYPENKPAQRVPLLVIREKAGMTYVALDSDQYVGEDFLMTGKKVVAFAYLPDVPPKYRKP